MRRHRPQVFRSLFSPSHATRPAFASFSRPVFQHSISRQTIRTYQHAAPPSDVEFLHVRRKVFSWRQQGIFLLYMGGSLVMFRVVVAKLAESLDIDLEEDVDGTF